jgi:beta-glucosidase
MKKFLKITIKVIGILFGLILIIGVFAWMYLKSSFLDFEGDFQEKTSFSTILLDGKDYVDRNGNGVLDVYEDEHAPIEDRVEDALAQMTLEEKLHLLKGSGISSAMGRDDVTTAIPGAVGTIVPTPRLGLPTLYLSDGPAGLRIEPTREGMDRTYYATAFPIGTLLASTWNTDLVREVGHAMGNEALSYGVDVILGPGANIHRHPFCGRNFEYFSEDPYLTGYIGAAMVNGIQSNGVGTSVKHFVANNQETNRNFNDALISERALREIYLKGFELIVKKSQPWTIMSSYNKVNGTYTSESHYLLTDILRKEWGFKGLVMSDWFGGNDAVAMVLAGNDLLEPGTNFQWKALRKGVEDGTLSESAINTSVRRILRLIIGSQKMKNYSYDENPDLYKHALITRKTASEGIVLLKNNQALPINQASKVALLGVTSYDLIVGGTGSGDVNEAYSISLEEGLSHQQGLVGLIDSGFSNSQIQINETATSIYENFKAANAEFFIKPEGLSAMMTPYSPPEIDYSVAQLNEIANQSDVAILTIGRNSGEGGDRTAEGDFELTPTEFNNIKKASNVFHAQGKKLIVVLNIGGVIETHSWKNFADGIVLSWQGGQEGGNSIAEILAGKVNPSGKLPMTFPVNVADHASHKNFPLEGKPIQMLSLFNNDQKEAAALIKNEDYTNYEEGIYVGYRHFDKAGLEVSFPFGFGLSYTHFELTHVATSINDQFISISVQVRNKGAVPGKEVVQVYVSKRNSVVDRPDHELKTFAKTSLIQPGAHQELSLRIPIEDLAYWDTNENKWLVEKGAYWIAIGNASRSISAVKEVVVD